MATTTIKKIEIGDLTVIIKREKTAADRIKAMLEWIAQKVGNTPDYGVGEGSPDQGLPGGGGRPGSPDNTLPGGGRPPQGGTKPVDPDEGQPDNSLPGGRPGAGAGQLPSGPGGSTKPTPPDEGQIGNQLPNFIHNNLDAIVSELLKGTPCDPRPK